MKGLIFSLVLLVSSNVFAAKMVNINELSNKTLEASRVQLNGLYKVITNTALKKVVEFEESEMSSEFKKASISFALYHACPFMGNQVEVEQNTNDEAGVRAATDTIVDRIIDRTNPQYTTITNALQAVAQTEGVEIYSGKADARRSYGTVLGFYDTNTNEVAVFANTTCGDER